MRFFKVILIFLGFAVLLPACNTEVLDSGCSALTSTGDASSSTSIDCSSFTNPTRQILTEQDYQELQNNLDIHRQLWESNNVNHYCFSDFRNIPATTNNFEIMNSVSNNRVYQFVLNTNGLSEVDLFRVSNVLNVLQYFSNNVGKTINDIFNDIQDNIDFFKLHYKKAEGLYGSDIHATYSQEYGYPILHGSYVSTITGGGGASYSISNFQIKN